MKFSVSFAPLLLVELVSARALSLFGGNEAVLDGQDSQLSVPGKNPLLYCTPRSSSDILTIDYVDLNPNPPSPGKNLVIEASGTLSENIEEGAYVHLIVKYGLIKLLEQKVDVCEEAGNIDLECPVEKGPLKLTKEFDLPREIPPGKYTVLADVYTADDRSITCLTATVTFGAPKIKIDLI